MFFRLSDGNDVICIAARGVYHENHDAIPNADGLKTHLATGVALVLTAHREARENLLSAHEIKSVLVDVLKTLGFVVTDHNQIVDAIFQKIKQIVGAIRFCPRKEPIRQERQGESAQSLKTPTKLPGVSWLAQIKYSPASWFYCGRDARAPFGKTSFIIRGDSNYHERQFNDASISIVIARAFVAPSLP
jgi:hypothetical protein